MRPVSLSTPWAGVLLSLLACLLGLATPPAAAQPPKVVSVSFEADRPAAAPGSIVLVAVRYTHESGWHIHTQAPVVPPELGDFEPFPTTLKVTPGPGVAVGTVQWPDPVKITVNMGEKPAKYGVLDHVAVAIVPVRIAAEATGEVSVSLATEFQACNEETCLPPDEAEGKVTIRVNAGAAASPDLSKPPFSEWKPTTVEAAAGEAGGTAPRAEPTPGASEGRLEFPFFGWSFSIDPRGVTGMALLLALAICGGFLLNVMPCVLPVLPLKIVALSQAAGTKRRTLLLGLVMSLGIVAFWLALGGAIALSTGFKSASQIISMWWFSVGIGVLMIVMSLSLLGTFFNLNVPGWAYAINPRHDTLHGSFLFGVLTAVLATPCVAPLAATAMGWAAFQPAPITMLVFTAIGAGMAIPYVLLAANPQWVDKVPRAGAGSELMKQTMALLMLAVASFFIGVGIRSLLVASPHLGETIHWWFTAAFSVIACGWLIIRLWQINAGATARIAFTIVGLIVGGTAVQFARYQTDLARESHVPADQGAAASGLWKPYTPELFERSRAEGKVVVVDFTAEWCLNCKAFEIILNEDEVQAQLARPDVVAIKADLTSPTLRDGSRNPAWDYMRDLKEVGPPVLVIYGPGRSDFFKANSYTKDVVLREIAKSRG
ncbi:MAG: Thiol:disulfide interchange protein DsbD precursor [Planctomycetota bacterium]|jgi:thiol:disulfide interchange protein DsbD